MERGKPYVGAKVWFSDSRRTYYEVTEVNEDEFACKAVSIVDDDMSSPHYYKNTAFLAPSELPYFAKQDALKFIKKHLK
jgi:hypothetical protein